MRKTRPFKSASAIWAPALLVVVGVPMALGVVPPNHCYGVRTAATFTSAEIWYRSNFRAGLVAVIAGSLALAVNLRITRSQFTA